jgi:hypothetical protein
MDRNPQAEARATGGLSQNAALCGLLFMDEMEEKA